MIEYGDDGIGRVKETSAYGDGYSYTYEVDDGTMPNNVAELAKAIEGHRIVSVKKEHRPGEYSWRGPEEVLVLTLDNGKEVILQDTGDCCAYTSLEGWEEHLPTVDHIITKVEATDDFQKWHILADLGEVLTLQVGWSCGNPFFYGYGFNIQVVDA